MFSDKVTLVLSGASVVFFLLAFLLRTHKNTLLLELMAVNTAAAAGGDVLLFWAEMKYGINPLAQALGRLPTRELTAKIGDALIRTIREMRRATVIAVLFALAALVTYLF